MPHRTNPFDSVSRRGVLQTAVGALAGTATFAGAVAGEECKAVTLTVKQRTINPDSRGVVPVRIGGMPAADEWTPDNVYFGHFEQFDTEGEEEGALSLPEDPEDPLATPVRTVEVGGRSGKTFTNDMLYDTKDVDFSEASGDDVEMALGIFPDGETSVPDRRWDTDTVKQPPDLDASA